MLLYNAALIILQDQTQKIWLNKLSAPWNTTCHNSETSDIKLYYSNITSSELPLAAAVTNHSLQSCNMNYSTSVPDHQMLQHLIVDFYSETPIVRVLEHYNFSSETPNVPTNKHNSSSDIPISKILAH